MTAPIYIYTGPHADAAFHLITYSALQYVTEVEETWYAGANCTKVTLTTPRLSSGERPLWDVAEALSRESSVVLDRLGLEYVDADNRAVLLVALGIAWGIRPVELRSAS